MQTGRCVPLLVNLRSKMACSPASTSEEDIDSLISEIVSCGTAEDSICTICESGSIASAKCMDCIAFLCPSCIEAHQRARVTSRHSIKGLRTASFCSSISTVESSSNCGDAATTATTASSSLQSASSSASTPHNITELPQEGLSPGTTPTNTSKYSAIRMQSVCDIHREESNKVYCETCYMPICLICAQSAHNEHQLTYLKEAYDMAYATNTKLMIETTSAIGVVHEAIKHVKKTSEKVEMRLATSNITITNCIRACIIALQKREAELSSKITFVRRYKSSRLTSQAENLNFALTKLNNISRVLNDALAPTSTIDPVVISERMTLELTRVRQIQSELLPCDSDNVYFLPPDDTIIHFINNMGTIVGFNENVQGMQPESANGNASYQAAYNSVNASSSSIGPSTSSSNGGGAVVLGGGAASLSHALMTRSSNATSRPYHHYYQSNSSAGRLVRSSSSVAIAGPSSMMSYGAGTLIGQYGGGAIAGPSTSTSVANYQHRLPDYITTLFPEPTRTPPPGNQYHTRSVFHCPNLIGMRDRMSRPAIVFGIAGGMDGELCRPWGVCCDHRGRIYIADRSNNRVQVFDANGLFIFKFGCTGNGDGFFNRPAGITISPNNTIVVCDKDNHRIQVFTMSGLYLFKFGSKGLLTGQFNYPWDVACNSKGEMVVSDTRNHRIQLFNSDGMFLAKYGFEGNNPIYKQFDSPRGICFTPDGRILVSDFNNHRLVVISRDMGHAQFLGYEGGNPRQFVRPQGVICDDYGNILVCDTRNNRIQAFNQTGTYLYSFGCIGKRPGDFDRPSDICYGPDGRVIIVDFGNNRVQIY